MKECDAIWRDNPLRTRSDLQRAVQGLCAPVEARRSAGGARIRLDGPHGTFSDTCQELEGFSRLLWGIVPLIAGGGSYDAIDDVRLGLIHGGDPDHPEFWGTPVDRDQKLVSFAAIAYALLVAPEIFWHSLSPAARTRMASWLAIINAREVHDNNWRWFRILVNLALARCDAPWSAPQLRRDLDRLEAWYLGSGWYADGSNRAVDYYNAYAMHFYGLIGAPALRDIDTSRAEVVLDRAAAFAHQLVHWFAADGAAIPYGRSLTYRWAPAAFWGALAGANLEVLPWGAIKGLVLRHLRWWRDRPVLSDAGLLTSGYGYPNPLLADRYSSACSPYWALKAFVPLALPEDAPFWRADEQPLPSGEAVVAQEQSGMLLCRDGDHLFALGAAARVPACVRHGAAKYGKFCYSSQFAFSVPASTETLAAAAPDSALALCESGDGVYRAREQSDAAAVSPACIVSTWKPWPDVIVTTWLVPLVPWHVRVHDVRTARALSAREGGFAIALGPEESDGRAWDAAWPREWVGTQTAGGVSIVINLFGDRSGDAIRADANTNVLAPRTVIPILHGDLPAGESLFACAVVAVVDPARMPGVMAGLPSFVRTHDGFAIHDAHGRIAFSAVAPSR